MQANPTDEQVIDMMEQYGGSFVKAIAKAFRCADLVNTAKLKATFPEYWNQYRDFAQTKSIIESHKSQDNN